MGWLSGLSVVYLIGSGGVMGFGLGLPAEEKAFGNTYKEIWR